MRVCYLAGPMRGVKSLNFPLFNKVAEILTFNNWQVLSPAKADIDAGEPWCDKLRPDWADEKYPFTAADCKRMVKRDVDTLMTLNPETDALFLLPAWKDSVGADAERAVSRWLLLDVLQLQCYNTRWLATHLHSARGNKLMQFSFKNPHD